ncbi:MAG: hypothetical protein ISS56_08275 [Anaerolineae bacterium]|nr:hypothetical protein [Anaerolineae bacterium]
MLSRSGRRPLWLFGVCVLAGGALLGTWLLASRSGSAVSAVGQEHARTGAQLLPESAIRGSGPVTAYLPFVARNYDGEPSIFGVEIEVGVVSATVSQAQQAGVSWVRYNGLLWSEVEAEPEIRDWSKVASFEQEIRLLSERGLTPVVVVRSAPQWAQKVEGTFCGPIREDALDEFASFMGEVVARYSGPPYNVKYWELGNEPDVDPVLVPPDNVFGCWGDEADTYYGGEYYGQMLKRAYGPIKEADPSARVVLGGLLLVCDPTGPNPAPGTDGCRPAKFLEGVLRAGGGAAFDILAYHAYTQWVAGYPDRDWDLTQGHWEHRGGALLGKLDYVREVMARYGVSKPVLMNEGGLICNASDSNPSDCLLEEFRSAQSSHLIKLYARAWANGLIGSAWYTLNGPGWRQGGLLDENQDPRDPYYALSFMAHLLETSHYSRQLASGTFEGYAFADPVARREYRVYWTNNGSKVFLPLPAGTVAVYSRYGQDITPAGGSVSVGSKPVFVEMTGP